MPYGRNVWDKKKTRFIFPYFILENVVVVVGVVVVVFVVVVFVVVVVVVTSFPSRSHSGSVVCRCLTQVLSYFAACTFSQIYACAAFHVIMTPL